MVLMRRSIRFSGLRTSTQSSILRFRIGNPVYRSCAETAKAI